MSVKGTSSSRIAEQGFRPGSRGRMGAPVEKPKNGKETMKRLAAYFRPEGGIVLALAAAVVVTVAPGATSSNTLWARVTPSCSVSVMV